MTATGGAGLSEVAAGVWVARSAVYATTTTVVLDDDGAALVVDPGVTRGELGALAAAVRGRGWRVVAGFATHAHWDHLLWHPGLGEAPRWARPAAVAATARRRADLVAEWTAEVGEPGPDQRVTFGAIVPLPEGCEGIPGWHAGAVVVGHEAHAPGHAALYLPRTRVLLAGDMLSDLETPLLDRDSADPLADYGAGLETLAGYLERGLVDAVVPGHGAVAGPAEARRRLALDRAYLADLAAGRPSADPRLAAAPPWLAAEHAAQVAAVGGGHAR